MTDKRELLKRVKMGRGASVLVARKKYGTVYEAIGCFYFTLPRGAAGDIRVTSMLDQGGNRVIRVPFCKGMNFTQNAQY